MPEWKQNLIKQTETQKTIEEKLSESINRIEKEITQKMGIDCDGISYESTPEQIFSMDHFIGEIAIILTETIYQNI